MLDLGTESHRQVNTYYMHCQDLRCQCLRIKPHKHIRVFICHSLHNHPHLHTWTRLRKENLHCVHSRAYRAVAHIWLAEKCIISYYASIRFFSRLPTIRRKTHYIFVKHRCEKLSIASYSQRDAPSVSKQRFEMLCDCFRLTETSITSFLYKNSKSLRSYLNHRVP